MELSENNSDYQFIADLYDHVVPYRTRPNVAFFVNAALAAQGPVLEVGCGTGRVLIPTARAGVPVTGVDLSSHMLDVCRSRLRNESDEVRSRVRLVRADMRQFELGTTFRLVTIPFRPFQHLISVRDQIGCLTTIRRHLVKGGELILDLFNPSHEALVRDNIGLEFGHEPEFTTPDGRRVRRLHKITGRDLHQQTMQVELIYEITRPSGGTERVVHAFAMRYLFRFEVEHLLARCGYRMGEVYSDYESRPYGALYPGELIVRAQKVGD